MKKLLYSCLMVAASVGVARSNEALVLASCTERALASPAECQCLQMLADETIRPGLHELIADNLGRQINVAAIAAERGHSGAEQLASEAYLFRRQARSQCSVDLPED